MTGPGTATAPPRWMAGLALLAVGFLVLPLIGLLAATPWNRVPELIMSAPSAMALRLSLVTSLSATAICLALGLPLALVLARLDGWRGRLLRILVTLPLVFPLSSRASPFSQHWVGAGCSAGGSTTPWASSSPSPRRG